MATNAQLLTRIVALEGKVTTLQTKVAALEARPPGTGTDYGPQITALQQADTALDGRLDVLETKTCVEQPRFVTIEGRLTALEGKSASEAAAQDILEADHTPEP